MKKNNIYLASLLLLLTFSTYSKEKIVIGYIPLISQLPLVVQYDNERINSHSFEMELIQYRSTTALEAALRVGAVHVAVLPTPQIISISADEIDVVAIGSIALGGSSLFGPIQEIKDLKGKVIGLTGFDSSENFVLQKVFAEFDLLAGVDFKAIGVSLSTIINDLEANKIDAIYLPEPYGSMAKDKHLGDFLDTKGLSSTQNDLLVAHRSFLINKTKIFKQWLQLLKKSISFINNDIEKGNSTILAKLQRSYLNIPENLFLTSINQKIGGIRYSFDPVNQKLLDEYYNRTQNLKIITKSVDIKKLSETNISLK